MIELPGCRSGRRISARPVLGPEAIQRTSLAIFSSAAASARSSPDRLTSASRAPWAAKWSWASWTVDARAARTAAPVTARAKPAGALSPVPVAVPPRGTSPTRSSAARDALGRLADLRGVAAELLAERDRRGVHQVGAPGLHDRGVGRRPARRARRRGGRGRAAGRGCASDRGGHVDRRGEHVVGRLRGVHLVVRVHRLGRGARPRGGRSPRWRSCWWTCPSRSGTCRPGTGRPTARRPPAAAAAAMAAATSRVDHAEVGVDLRGRRLDRAQRVDQRRLDRPARHGEVLDRPLRLRRPTGPPPGTRTSPIVSCSTRKSSVGHAPTVRRRDVPSSRSAAPDVPSSGGRTRARIPGGRPMPALPPPAPARRPRGRRRSSAAACGDDDSGSDDPTVQDGRWHRRRRGRRRRHRRRGRPTTAAATSATRATLHHPRRAGGGLRLRRGTRASPPTGPDRRRRSAPGATPTPRCPSRSSRCRRHTTTACEGTLHRAGHAGRRRRTTQLDKDAIPVDEDLEHRRRGLPHRAATVYVLDGDTSTRFIDHRRRQRRGHRRASNRRWPTKAVPTAEPRGR